MLNDHSHHLSKGARALLNTVLLVSIIGALNWGLIGFFNWNLIDAIFGGGAREMTSAVSRVIYALVGLAGLVAAYYLALANAAERHDQIAPAPPSR